MRKQKHRFNEIADKRRIEKLIIIKKRKQEIQTCRLNIQTVMKTRKQDAIRKNFLIADV